MRSHVLGIWTLVLYILLTAGLVVSSSAQQFIPLWPESFIQQTPGIALKDSIVNDRIVKVGIPGMWAFFPSAQENKGAAVIICPGGGYERLAYNAAGLQIAKWFNTFGVNAFVLKYRLPNAPNLRNRQLVPLQDAQRAMRLIRAHAKQWGIVPDKIGIFGTSAGGHLAALLGTHGGDVSAIGDPFDTAAFRPNFLILISPVIDLGTYAHVGSRKNLLGPSASQELIREYSPYLHVTSATPPSFIVQAFNDPAVPVRNSFLFAQALLDSNVQVSYHVFPQGAHSIGLRDNPGSTALWISLCEQWMAEMGFTSGKK
ncbi:MAG: alpha/beta hydrolase [Ignavibacteriae bacterium]|nr:MAG: alpha/beta hydrolase [Ignavibacteriota bacterium]